jgi:hypothetical protein
VKIEWSPAATALARQYMRDQDGIRAMGVAVAALAVDPYPPTAAAPPPISRFTAAWPR